MIVSDTGTGQKHLPVGQFIFLRNLPAEATDKDLQALIYERTGISIPLDRIRIDRPLPGYSTGRGMVSLDKKHIIQLMAWALSEDQLYGRPIEVQLPASRERQAA